MNEQRLNRSPPSPQDPFDSRMKRKREFLIERNTSPLFLSLSLSLSMHKVEERNNFQSSVKNSTPLPPVLHESNLSLLTTSLR